MRRLAGLVVAAATLLVLAPSGIAQAGEIQIPVPTSGEADSLTVTGDFDAMKGHTYRALRVGKYQTASGMLSSDSSKDGVLGEVNVETVGNVVSIAADALHQVTNAAPDPAFTGNPMGEVASKWTGFSGTDTTSDAKTEAWDGELRQFVTALVAEPAFATLIRQSYVSTANAPAAANLAGGKASFSFTHILPGIYVVVDVTNLQNVPVPDVMHNPNADLSHTPAPDDTTALRNSIAMMTETAITTAAGKKYTTEMNGRPLGQIELKSDKPGMTMSASTSAALVGDSIAYTLKTHVPLTTGFPAGQYLFTVVDTPDPGLVFTDPDSVRVRLTIHDAPAGQSLQRISPTPKDYKLTDSELGDVGFKHAEFPSSDTDRGGDTRFVAFDFTPMLKHLGFGEDIAITFKMKITDHATNQVKNLAKLYFSNDPANPYTGVVATLAETGSVTHWVPSTPLVPATPNSKPQKPSVPSTPLTPATPVCSAGQKPDGNHHCSPVDHTQPPEVVTYLRHINLLSIDKKTKQHLKDTQFRIKLSSESAAHSGASASMRSPLLDASMTLASQGDGGYLKFHKNDDGNYTVASADDKTATDIITVCCKNIRTGELKIYGLADNSTYEVSEVTRPQGCPHTPLARFNVSVMGSRRDPATDVYRNTTDVLHLDLVNAHLADTDPDVEPIDVYALTSLSQLPATGDIWIILALVVAVLLLLAVAILAAVRRHRAQQDALTL